MSSHLGGTYLPKGHDVVLHAAVINFQRFLAVISHDHSQVWIILTKTPEHGHELVGTEEGFGGNSHQVSEFPLWARKGRCQSTVFQEASLFYVHCSVVSSCHSLSVFVGLMPQKMLNKGLLGWEINIFMFPYVHGSIIRGGQDKETALER